MKIGFIAAILAVLIGMLVFMFVDFEPSIDRQIDDAVKVSQRSLNDFKKDNASVIAAKCFRDGDEPGIVMEYTFAEGVKLKKPDLKKLKEDLRRFRHNPPLMKIIKQGIHLKVVYKGFAGNTIVSFVMHYKDFTTDTSEQKKTVPKPETTFEPEVHFEPKD